MTDVRLVRDLMTVGVPTCPADTLITEVARLILQEEWESIVVLNDEGHAVGVVSQDELVGAYAADSARPLTAEEIMHEGVPEIPPDIPLTAAAQIMQDQKVRALFLMHHSDGISYPAAMLSYRHLLRHLAAQDQIELKDLGVRAERESPLETFIRRRDAARRRLPPG